MIWSFQAPKREAGNAGNACCQSSKRWQTQEKYITFPFHFHSFHIFYLNPNQQKYHTILQQKPFKRTVCSWKDGILERKVIFSNHSGRVEKRTCTQKMHLSSLVEMIESPSVEMIEVLQTDNINKFPPKQQQAGSKPRFPWNDGESGRSRAMFAVASLEF